MMCWSAQGWEETSPAGEVKESFTEELKGDEQELWGDIWNKTIVWAGLDTSSEIEPVS